MASRAARLLTAPTTKRGQPVVLVTRRLNLSPQYYRPVRYLLSDATRQKARCGRHTHFRILNATPTHHALGLIVAHSVHLPGVGQRGVLSCLVDSLASVHSRCNELEYRPVGSDRVVSCVAIGDAQATIRSTSMAFAEVGVRGIAHCDSNDSFDRMGSHSIHPNCSAVRTR